MGDAWRPVSGGSRCVYSRQCAAMESRQQHVSFQQHFTFSSSTSVMSRAKRVTSRSISLNLAHSKPPFRQVSSLEIPLKRKHWNRTHDPICMMCWKCALVFQKTLSSGHLECCMTCLE
ncbi:hypothetical protein JTE90_010846 [Oedothorax gibbosus]|uniref:Uncharacterized protein n=1 Tax=Oedothorax gibbosus TaxID=931172 RepID=A0AAV6V4M5_9ARAC|nr:hypothetical protein JTE90_010846 [Oedothorax gibbosus]